MNLDANIQKLISTVLKKWKLIVIFAVIGALLAFFYTSHFTTLTYSSSVEFLAYAQDTQQDLAESSTIVQATSNTSKMNYAMKALNTYIELFKTNEFNQNVADEINENYSTSYSAGTIKGATTITTIEDTAMFRVTITTTNADLSYQIAHQLEKSIPEKMKNTSDGIVRASVEDKALKATTSESLGYPKKITIGFLAGAILAVAYIILRDFIDVRIKSSDELTEIYDIPVLGTIPEFEFKQTTKSERKAVSEEVNGNV
ncbi:MAG: Wzz/FepE/Etk N-terminal domain-containing protein [Clostridium sp.]|nr:Wzz/FepE/Etk N-terminal domain-containing protein [Clostridium sp.]